MNYTTNIGDYLIIGITGMIGTYIAEVTGIGPLVMKVQESGPFSCLKEGDFIIQEVATERLQEDNREGENTFLKTMISGGHKVLSGLASLGVTDGKLHEMLPE